MCRKKLYCRACQYLFDIITVLFYTRKKKKGANYENKRFDYFKRECLPVDGKVPIKTAVPFGLQHILAMFVANISPILIVAASVVTAIGFSLLSVGASSFGGGTGFTQVPEIFAIFPQIVENVFAENCVAVVFLVSIILNLVLPKNMEAAGN